LSNSAWTNATVVFIWIALLYKLFTLHWRPRDATQWAYVRTHLMLALAFTTFCSPIYLAIDRFTGIPNVARLIGNGLGVIGGWCFQPVTAQLESPASPETRRVYAFLGSGWLLAVILAALVALFSRASLPISAPLDFPQRYSTAPFVAPYRLVLMLAIVLVTGRVFWASLRNYAIVGQSPRAYRRIQTHLQTVGWGLCLGYASQESVFIVLVLLRRVPAQAYPVVLANTCLVGGTVCLLSSMFFDAWHWCMQYRTHRRLYPLWRDLYEITPEIALDPPRSAFADALDPRDLGLRLYRRVTETRDGIDALRPYRDTALVMQDGVHRGEARSHRGAALTTAVNLHAAIDAKRNGRIASAGDAVPLVSSGTSFEEETRVLERAAGGYVRLRGKPRCQPQEVREEA